MRDQVAAGEPVTLAIVAGNLGYIALREDEMETARMQFQQTLELNRELSDRAVRPSPAPEWP